MKNHFIPTFVCDFVNIMFIFSSTIKPRKSKKIKTVLQNHVKLSVLGYVKNRSSSVVSSKNLIFCLPLLVFCAAFLYLMRYCPTVK